MQIYIRKQRQHHQRRPNLGDGHPPIFGLGSCCRVPVLPGRAGDAVPDGDLLRPTRMSSTDSACPAVFDGGGGCVAAQLGEEAFHAGQGEVGVPVGGLASRASSWPRRFGAGAASWRAARRWSGSRSEVASIMAVIEAALASSSSRRLRWRVAGSAVRAASSRLLISADQGRVGEQGGDVVPHDGVVQGRLVAADPAAFGSRRWHGRVHLPPGGAAEVR